MAVLNEPQDLRHHLFP